MAVLVKVYGGAAAWMICTVRVPVVKIVRMTVRMTKILFMMGIFGRRVPI